MARRWGEPGVTTVEPLLVPGAAAGRVVIVERGPTRDPCGGAR